MKKGDRVRGFVVKEVSPIEEIHVTVLRLVHETSGAEVVHIACEDEENVFALSHKTLPEDDTGAPHILEHTVLCGSANYPVSDPFFSMLRRSANTFMNAFTAKTWTCYPAASVIEKDFYNLLSVYLDAVFHPNLSKESFQQEGHHYEFENPTDPSTPLTIKGIVYNEMKGVYSSPTALMYRNLSAGIFPDHPYGYDSGGMPEAITNLTHEGLIAFHKKYYHPSRCLYFFYGNIETEKHLAFLEDHLLKNIKKVDPLPPLPLMKRFKKPKREQLSYPCSDEDTNQKSFIGFSWLMMNIEEEEDLMTLMLLDSILMDTDASPLKQKLIESGLCTSAGATYDPDVREIPYLLSCVGSNAENADKIENLIFSTLKEISEKKISKELVESSLYQLEFLRSEKSGDGHPYGFELYFRTALSYQQGGSLTDQLRIHSLFDALRERTKDSSYLPSMIQKYFLDNPHMYRLTLVPDKDLDKRQREREKEELASIKERLSQKEIKAILQNTAHLKQHHEKKQQENINCLPMLQLNDLPTEVPYFPLHKDIEKNLSIYYHNNFTNDIIYTDLIFDIPQTAEEDLLYLQLFANFLTDLGAGGRDYLENLKLIHKTLGSIHAHLSLNVQVKQPDSALPTFTLSARALKREAKEMTKIMADFLLNLGYRDERRIRELVLRAYTALSTKFNSNALGYAIKQSSAGFSPWSHISNLWHGAPYFHFIRDLAENIEERLPIIVQKFGEFGKTLFHLNNPQLVLSCSKENYEELKEKDFYSLSKFGASSNAFSPWIDFPSPRPIENGAFATSSGVANNAFALSTVTIQSPHSPALKLAGYMMENLYVHPIIREQNGAYTCHVRYNAPTGTLYMYSSRDPAIMSSYQAFETAIRCIAEGKFSGDDLHEAKLCYAQDTDHPTPASVKASVTFFQHKVGLSKEMRQDFRNSVLNLREADVESSVKECLLGKIENAVKVTYAPESRLTECAFVKK